MSIRETVFNNTNRNGIPNNQSMSKNSTINTTPHMPNHRRTQSQVEVSSFENFNIDDASDINNGIQNNRPSENTEEFSNEEKEFILQMENKVKKEKEIMKASQKTRKKLSKYSKLVLGEQFTEEDQKKMGLHMSEFSYKMKAETNLDERKEDGRRGIVSSLLKKNVSESVQDERIFKWRSKSRRKTEKHELILQTEFDIGKEEHVPHDKKLNLSNVLQKQFDTSRITLPNPDRIEIYRNEKFVRDKSMIARAAEFLIREIKYEKINDKEKLASSIFADIEKQESWQSYTTLLFTNAEVNFENNQQIAKK